MIQVGTGGFGKAWCQRFLPPNVADGLIEVVAAVDVNPDALANARDFLDLPADRCYTNMQEAFDRHPADFCTIVVPPAFHESVVDLALAHDMHILSEKPIADTLLASCRIAEKVQGAGKKMAVTMSHRFDQDKTTLRMALKPELTGPVDYLVGRFTDDCRVFGSWGRFRYEIHDPLLIEGAVHHLDILADLAGSPCHSIYAETWNPPWGEFAGDSQALVTMQFENGGRAFYEGATTNAVRLNGWSNEYIRAECEQATVVLDHRRVEYFRHSPDRAPDGAREGAGTPVPLLEQRKWSHAWLIEKFVQWLEGGIPVETEVERNLQSAAMIFAAIESSRRKQPVLVQELLAHARDEVRQNGAGLDQVCCCG